MKSVYVLLIFFMFASSLDAQQKMIDSLAVKILDRMSDVIGDLHSCSFTVNTEYDSLDEDFGFLKHHNESKIYFSGPDKFLLLSQGEKGHRGLWYNGEELAFYSYTNNHYGFMDVPKNNSIQAIDTMHERYGFDFPASDFFYPGFTDDLIDHSDRIDFLGQVEVNGVNCFYVVAKGKEIGVQLWIKDDAYNLPVKMVIINYFKGSPRQYEANYSDWSLNPDIPESIFNFTVPPSATMLTILRAK